MAPRDLYKILQVDPEAEPEVIQAAYRRLARKYHPDVAGDVASERSAATRMAEINEAWAILGDPHRRAAYDADRNAATSPSRAGRDAPADRMAPFGSDRAGSWSGRPRAAEGPGGDAWPGGSGHDVAGAGPGSAGPPPGNPAGSVLNFGRYAGWSLGEIGRRDPDFLEQLDRIPIGRRYRGEIDQILRRLGRRGGAQDPARGAGPYRRG